MSDLPFSAEYAKSGRAGCKMCSGNIAQDSLRLAVMIQSPHFDGKVPNWYHYNCFWKRARVKSEGDIHGFNSLRWEDQQKIKEKIASGGGVSATPSGQSYTDFTTEYAKSSQSTCRSCDNKIAKNELRLSKKDFESQRAKMFGPQDQWYHVDCFVAHRDELEFGTDKDTTMIAGFAKLMKEDKDMLLEKLGKGEKKKRKADGEASSSASKKAKRETEEEKALKEQSQMYWKVRDTLQREVSLDALRVLLEYNQQQVRSGESKLLDGVTDAMVFGALEPCPECSGQLVFSESTSGYRCTGNITEWTKCLYFTKNPGRKAFKVPKEFHDVDILKNYKYVKRTRILPAEEASASKTNGHAASKPTSAAASSSKPLNGIQFSIIGKTLKKKADIEEVIGKLGGKIAAFGGKTAVCISTKDEVQKLGKVMKKAKDGDVLVIDEEFIDEVSKESGNINQLMKKHKISSWGPDTIKLSSDCMDVLSAPASAAFKSLGKSMVTAKDEAYFVKSVPATVKMTVKGGAAVDPESGLADKAHVLKEDKDTLYNAVLGLVDILKGTNSYYKLQLLESDKHTKWWVFRAWGRVGTTIGGTKVEPFGSKANAKDAFCALYKDKTGNDWDNRKDFVKVPNKFYPLDIDYGSDDAVVRKLDASAGSRSTLPPEVQSLIRMIFDVESMQKAMLEYEIDLKKMPLGKLSKKQIESAYKVLTELQQLIENGGTQTQFLDGSNRFYTLIPHDFGMKKPPLLDNVELIQSKTEMLDNLLDIEIAYNMLKTGDDSAKDPLDVHYEKLKTNIGVMDKKSDEFKRLKEFVRNTHAATHQQYELEIKNVFTIEREGEAKMYRPFKDLHNRKLLWHGSRTTNFAGILSQGLRIAPPEAPVTGYMFGKGIYFADMVSKSANYCYASKSDPKGLLLLCEVALGNMYEKTAAEFVKKLPKGKHSTKGCGRTAPDPSGSQVTSDGVEIPMGVGTDSGVDDSSLLYNEYIVYDVAQVNIKYLLQLDFKYRW